MLTKKIQNSEHSVKLAVFVLVMYSWKYLRGFS